MASNDYKPKPLDHVDYTERISEQRRAFLEYKKRVSKTGKPFFPNGVYHDVIAAAGVMIAIIALSFMWFGMANCDSPWNVSCNTVSTPLEQEQYTPGHPGKELEEGAEHDTPILGLLYEEKADPSSTSYHPRPEWYFYFLFYLLIVFSNPQMVVLGTIVVPTIWLVMLIALPIVDRRKERRPSRRPLAMSLMVVTAIALLSFTYQGSQAGKEDGGGPEGLDDAQIAMPGYTVLFEDGVFETCAACHTLGGMGNGSSGPDLTEVGTVYDSADKLVEVLANGLGGGAMPPKGGAAMTDEQAAQVAAFLKTLGAPADAASLASYGQADWDRVTGGGGDAKADADKADAEPAAAPAEADAEAAS